MNDKETLKLSQLMIESQRKALAALEKEKAQLIEKFQVASAEKQKELAKEMEQSVQKYQQLLSEVTEHAKEIKKLKNKICG